MNDNSQYGHIKKAAEILEAVFDEGNGQLRVNDSTADGGAADDVAVTSNEARARRPLLVDAETGRLLVQSEGGSGGGGGGAVTIADGADYALGSRSNAPATDPLQEASLISWAKGIVSLLRGVLTVTVQGGSVQPAREVSSDTPTWLRVNPSSGRLLVDAYITPPEGGSDEPFPDNMPVFIDDGASVTLGRMADGPLTNTTRKNAEGHDVPQKGTVISWLKGIVKLLQSTLSVNIVGGDVKVAAPEGGGATTMLQVDPASGRLLVAIDSTVGIGDVTIPDGGSVTLGVLDDAALMNTTYMDKGVERQQPGSVISWLKGIVTLLQRTLSVNVLGGEVKVATATGSGDATMLRTDPESGRLLVSIDASDVVFSGDLQMADGANEALGSTDDPAIVQIWTGQNMDVPVPGTAISWLKGIVSVLQAGIPVAKRLIREEAPAPDTWKNSHLEMAEGGELRVIDERLTVDEDGRLLVAGIGGDGGGGGASGAVTVADGANVALGSTTNPALIDEASSGTVISFLKGIVSLLRGPLTVAREAGGSAPASLRVDAGTGRLLVSVEGGGSGGGGGGGAVTIVDGGSETLGSISDPSQDDHIQPATVVSLLKGILRKVGLLGDRLDEELLVAGDVTVARLSNDQDVHAPLLVHPDSGHLLVQFADNAVIGTVAQGAAGGQAWLTRDNNLAGIVGAHDDTPASGNGSVIAILKAIRAALLGTEGALVVQDAHRISVKMPARASLALSGSAQWLRSGASGNTFSAAPREIMINCASHACYIATTAALAMRDETGLIDDRIYVPAGVTGLVLPWVAQNVYFVNAVSGEAPEIFVTGLK